MAKPNPSVPVSLDWEDYIRYEISEYKSDLSDNPRIFYKIWDNDVQSHYERTFPTRDKAAQLVRELNRKENS